MLGVSGAKSFSGFMVAAPGAPRSPETPQPAAARAAPGPGESAAPRCLRRRLMDHAALGLPVSLRRLALSWNPGPGPRPRTPVPGRLTAHATRSRPAQAVLKGQRPCYMDHVTLQPLPPSASRTVPLASHAPARRLQVGCPRPQGSVSSPHARAWFQMVRAGRVVRALKCLHVVGKARGGLLCTFRSTKGFVEPDLRSTAC